MNMRSPLSAGTIERVLRHNLSQPGSAVQEAAGWDASNVSRVLSGQQGVPVAKLDAIGVLSRVGAYCHCARSGGGECGPANRASCGE